MVIPELALHQYLITLVVVDTPAAFKDKLQGQDKFLNLIRHIQELVCRTSESHS